MKKVIVMVLSVAATFCGWAATETVDGITWTYTVSDGEAVIGNGSAAAITSQHSGDISVPSVLGNYPVGTINSSAFRYSSALGVLIPDSVTSVSYKAFEYCNKLTRIEFTNPFTSIYHYYFNGGYSASFYECSSIVDVTIPQSACDIGMKRAFCSSYGMITNIVVLEGVTNINTSAAYGCSNLVSIKIADSVSHIGDHAFYGCSALPEIVISKNVKSISESTFSNCTNLRKVVFNNPSTTIDSRYNSSDTSYSFYKCNSIVDVTIPQISRMSSAFPDSYNSITNVVILEGVKEISGNAFSDCHLLRNVEIPNSVTKIGSSAFSVCRSLKNVEIPDNVISIASSAFSDCTSLESIMLGDSVSSIGMNVFKGCTSLIDIVGIPQCVCTSSVAKVFPASYHSITNIVLADNNTRIGAECFKDCFEVKRIVIPASVTAIYDNAFKNCSALEEIVFLGDAPDVGNDILMGTPRSLKITVKEGSVGWKGGVSTELPEAWPVGDATARGISYYDESIDVAAMTPVITPADGSIFADTCEVSISCAMEGAKIYYRTDGKTPKFTDAYLYKGAFTISDTSRIVAVAVKEGVENGFATATLTKQVLTLAEAAGDADLTFTTGGAADWVPIGDLTAADGVSARSGAVGDEEESWMELSVSGSGTLTFNWKVSCEDDPVSATWDHLTVFVDGNEREDLCFDGETGWENASIVLDSEGVHTVRWVYVKDESDSEGEDCAWVSGVEWKPVNQIVDVGDGKSVVVPTEWIDRYESIVSDAGGDKAAALQRTAANGRKVWECFMLGVDPTKADDDFRITHFWMENGEPKFEFSHSADGSGNSFMPRIKPLGKAKLSDSWQDVPPGGDTSFRFFTVEVALP